MSSKRPHHEDQQDAAREWTPDGVRTTNRRSFVKWTGAAVAAALVGCRPDDALLAPMPKPRRPRFTSAPLFASLPTEEWNPVADGSVTGAPGTTETLSPVTMAQLQSRVDALAATSGSHEIVIPDGSTLTGSLLLAQKTNGCTWIRIVSASFKYGVTPPKDYYKRITSADASYMVTMQSDSTQYSGTRPVISSPNDNYGTWTGGAASRTNQYYFRGITFQSSTSNSVGLVWMGDIRTGDLPQATTNLGNCMPTEWCFHHCRFVGSVNASIDGVRRGIDHNAKRLAVLDCSFEDIACGNGGTGDYSAYHCQDAAGPVLLQNTYFRSGGINVFTGGGKAPTGIIIENITIRDCHMYKDPAWMSVSGLKNKNLLEFKIGRKILVEGCVLENSIISTATGAAGNQYGPGVCIKAVNQDGDSLATYMTEDVTVRNNVVLNCAEPLYISPGENYTGGNVDGVRRLDVQDNVFEAGLPAHTGLSYYTDATTNNTKHVLLYIGSGSFGTGTKPYSWAIRRNTFVQEPNANGTNYMTYGHSRYFVGTTRAIGGGNVTGQGDDTAWALITDGGLLQDNVIDAMANHHSDDHGTVDIGELGYDRWNINCQRNLLTPASRNANYASQGFASQGSLSPQMVVDGTTIPWTNKLGKDYTLTGSTYATASTAGTKPGAPDDLANVAGSTHVAAVRAGFN